MIDTERLLQLSRQYRTPLEDTMFISLNMSGVSFKCDYNRMRTAVRLENHELFGYAEERNELEYYFALPINDSSPFRISGDVLSLGDTAIGSTVGATEDICDSHYPRRRGTSLNLNPNSRTSCRGCEFCYTAYQVPCDRKKLRDRRDLEEFFEGWMKGRCLSDLSGLIQVSVVTGCYDGGKEVCRFILELRSVLSRYGFNGSIFYLGSQLTTEDELSRLEAAKPVSVCYSLETFERRELLRDKKRLLSLNRAVELMDFSRESGYETSFSYVIGLEPLHIVGKHFSYLKDHINKFPIINTLQIHKYHRAELADPSVDGPEYYLRARRLLEQIFSDTPMRPLVWENYRSLWFLTFNNEPLYGWRTP
ncbi:MAG: hypothetical protein KGI50_05715 [Patescibacteria group bacterium]|nr:hypothetical protein [Patescibacteria group bacterium]MDE1971040.1 hypothetical protein [Patescibacteria group bacterium]